MRLQRTILGGAIGLPLVMTGYIYLLEIGGMRPPFVRLPVPLFFEIVVFYGSLAVLGAALGAAVHQRLIAAIGGILIALAAIPLVGAGWGARVLLLPTFLLATIITTAGGLLLVTTAYLTRNHTAVRRSLTPRQRHAGVMGAIIHLAGIGVVVGVFGLWSGARAIEVAGTTRPADGLLVVFTLAGVLAVGAVLAVLTARWRVIAPLVVVGGTFAWSAYATWQHLNGTVIVSNPEAYSPAPIETYAALWYFLLALGILLGVFERRLRTQRDQGLSVSDLRGGHIGQQEDSP